MNNNNKKVVFFVFVSLIHLIVKLDSNELIASSVPNFEKISTSSSKLKLSSIAGFCKKIDDGLLFKNKTFAIRFGTVVVTTIVFVCDQTNLNLLIFTYTERKLVRNFPYHCLSNTQQKLRLLLDCCLQPLQSHSFFSVVNNSMFIYRNQNTQIDSLFLKTTVF